MIRAICLLYCVGYRSWLPHLGSLVVYLAFLNVCRIKDQATHFESELNPWLTSNFKLGIRLKDCIINVLYTKPHIFKIMDINTHISADKSSTQGNTPQYAFVVLCCLFLPILSPSLYGYCKTQRKNHYRM